MVTYLRLISAIIFIYLYGGLTLYLIGYDRRDLLRRPYLLFCFGSGFIAFTMFAMLFFAIPISLNNNLSALFILLLLSIFKKILMGDKAGKAWTLYDTASVFPKKGVDTFDRWICVVSVIVIAIQLIYLLIMCLERPESSWDGILYWGFKAKVLYVQRGIYIDYFTHPRYEYSAPSYPLLLPINMANIYLFLGGINDRLVKILFFLYFTMLLAAFFDILKRYVTLPRALFFTAFLATIPTLLIGGGSAAACVAYVPMAFYCFIAVMFFIAYIKDQRFGLIIALSLILLFCAMTKSQGIYYNVILVLSLGAYILLFTKVGVEKRAIFFRHLILLGALFFLLYLPWAIFERAFIQFGHPNFPGAISFTYILSKLHRLWFVVPMLAWECLKLWHWHIAWIVFAIGLIYGFKKKYFEKEIIYLLSVILGFFIFYTAAYALSSWWGVASDETCRALIRCDASGLLSEAVPIVIFSSALLTAQKKA